MAVVEKTSTGLPKNTAAALAYSIGWMTGIIFLLVEKDKFVRFHAMQSIIVFGLWTFILVFPLFWIITPLVWIVGFASFCWFRKETSNKRKDLQVKILGKMIEKLTILCFSANTPLLASRITDIEICPKSVWESLGTLIQKREDAIFMRDSTNLWRDPLEEAPGPMILLGVPLAVVNTEVSAKRIQRL